MHCLLPVRHHVVSVSNLLCGVVSRWFCVQSLHVNYIVAAANLLAFVFGIERTRDRASVANMASSVVVAEFVPRTDVRIAQTDDEYRQNRQSVTVGNLY